MPHVGNLNRCGGGSRSAIGELVKPSVQVRTSGRSCWFESSSLNRGLNRMAATGHEQVSTARRLAAHRQSGCREDTTAERSSVGGLHRNAWL